jgi:hypothetical protein
MRQLTQTQTKSSHHRTFFLSFDVISEGSNRAFTRNSIDTGDATKTSRMWRKIDVISKKINAWYRSEGLAKRPRHRSQDRTRVSTMKLGLLQ